MARNKGTEPYEVGYGKPPTESQWKKGQSGNPKGRKARPNSVAERIQALLDRKIRTASGDMIPYSDAILNVAMNGLLDRSKSVKPLLEIIRFLREFDTKVDFVPTANDEARLQQLLDRVRRDAVSVVEAMPHDEDS